MRSRGFGKNFFGNEFSGPKVRDLRVKKAYFTVAQKLTNKALKLMNL